MADGGPDWRKIFGEVVTREPHWPPAVLAHTPLPQLWSLLIEAGDDPPDPDAPQCMDDVVGRVNAMRAERGLGPVTVH